MEYYFFFLKIIILFFFLSSCENDLAEVERVIKKEELQFETMKGGVEMLYSDSAIVRVKVTGPTMLRYLNKEEPTQEFPDGVNVDFFSPSGRVSSQLSSKYAIRYEGKKNILVKDSVVWKSKLDEILETEELIWDEKEERVYTKKFVKITRPDEIVYGYGLDANQDFTRWKIEAITGRIKVDGISKEFK